MASYPPPPPYGFDPRDQQRSFRDQQRTQFKQAERAQKAAYRSQRELLRQQNRSLRRSSILGPLLVLTIGILALVISTGRLPLALFAAWYARWWPLLIVAAGVILLGEWAFDQAFAGKTPEGAPAYTRRGLGGGAVTLLILLIFFGLTSRSVHDNQDFFTNTFSINPGNFDQVFGEKYDREQTVDHTLAPGTAVSLENGHGDITVTGTSADNALHLTLSKEVYGHSAATADSKADQLQPQIQMAGGVLRVLIPNVEGAHADLNLTLPEHTALTLTSSHGDLRVSNLTAPLDITSSHGDIDLNSITAPVLSRMGSSGSSFAAHNVTGDVSLKGRADNISLTDIAGQVTLDGEFFGDTHLERLHGPVVFRTNRTQFQLARLDGEVDISPDSDLTGSNILGPTELRTRSRNINLEGVTGRVDVTNTNGSVDLSNNLPLGNVTVDNRDGAVNVTVPTHAGLVIDAQARDGHIENDLALQPVSSNDNQDLHTTTGNGEAHLNLRTTHADIAIHQHPVANPK